MSPFFTSPNHEWYMVNAMAIFSGDVQYTQNGTGKPTHGFHRVILGQGGVPQL